MFCFPWARMDVIREYAVSPGIVICFLILRKQNVAEIRKQTQTLSSGGKQTRPPPPSEYEPSTVRPLTPKTEFVPCERFRSPARPARSPRCPGRGHGGARSASPVIPRSAARHERAGCCSAGTRRSHDLVAGRATRPNSELNAGE